MGGSGANGLIKKHSHWDAVENLTICQKSLGAL